MERNGAQDWTAWHDQYDDDASPLSRRLAVVREQIKVFLDEAPPGRLKAVSACAGQGGDLIGALSDHPRRDDVEARLVELEEGNVRAARESVRAAGLTHVDVVAGDASRTGAYAGAVPAALVLACGIFGNVTDADIERTVSLLPRLCAEGAHVIWTRNRRAPDVVPRICRWFEEHGFRERRLVSLEKGHCVGVHQYTGKPVPLGDDVSMFEFVGYRGLR